MAASIPQVLTENGVTVVQLGPEYDSLDEGNLDDLRDFLLQLADQTDPPWLVIDLSNTNFFGSIFIEVLFRMWNRLNARGGCFVLSGLREFCAEVLYTSRLDKLWDFYPNSKAAVEALKNRRP